TLITIKESHWNVQSDHYSDKTGTMVINLSGISIPRSHFNSVDVFVNDMRNMRSDDLAIEIGRLFTTFYGMTHTVGTRLIARALGKEGKAVNDVDLNDLDNAATKIVQKNLFVLQPYVELGKGLLKDRLDKLQAAEKQNPGAIAVAMDEMKKQAQDKYFETNVPGFAGHNAKDMKALAALIKQAIDDAKESNRIFLPFIYLEGERFHQLRNYLAELGIEWILQGTGDQHINYQQVLSQPQAYLPFIVSVVPLVESEGRPAIGFAKGYLDNISPNMIRDYFAEASYRALTEEVPKKLGHPEWCKGIFLRLADTEEDLNMLKGAFKMAVENGVKNVGQNDNDTLIADVSAKTGDITVHRNVPNLINAVHVDNKEIAIVVNKNLITKTLAEVSPELRVVFEKEYQVMRQSLSKMFPNENKGVIETNENDIEAITNELIKQGKKVVILDNGFMLGNWDNNTQHIAGVSGVNYCVISAASHPEKELKDAVEFLNLTAMALMGVGVLTDGRDILLFEKAYRLFTGEDPSPEMMEPIRRDPLATVFAIKVLPRMLMLSGSIVERETIRRLFAAAA
ncbi:MAG TPA: hypothetical protein PKG81_08085, partial [Candidatus Omnitrophota bacterium]|nr:hypothetical protein [Candidatus Omnitrophota bacterium]